MAKLTGYDKNGLPYGLLKVHDSVLEDTVEYFEKGKDFRKVAKDARKAIKKALKLTKKKDINMLEPIEEARALIMDFREEMGFMRKVIATTSLNMEDALKLIIEERIDEPLAMMDNARDLFRKKEYEKAREMLEKSQKEIEKKDFEKTRTALFGGLSTDIKELKMEIEERRKKPSKESRE